MGHIAPHMNEVCLDVDVLPAQAQHLPAPHPRKKQQHKQAFFGWLQSVQAGNDLLELLQRQGFARTGFI